MPSHDDRGRAEGIAVDSKVRPRRMPLRERLRWRVAELLNRHPRLCWASLGAWALYGGEIRDRTWKNARCLDECGSCWCNKRNPSEGRP